MAILLEVQTVECQLLLTLFEKSAKTVVNSCINMDIKCKEKGIAYFQQCPFRYLCFKFY